MGKQSFTYVAWGGAYTQTRWVLAPKPALLVTKALSGYWAFPNFQVQGKKRGKEGNLDHFYAKVICKTAALTPFGSMLDVRDLWTCWISLRSTMTSGNTGKCQGPIVTLGKHYCPQQQVGSAVLFTSGCCDYRPWTASAAKHKSRISDSAFHFFFLSAVKVWEGRGGISKHSWSSIQHKTWPSK